MEVFYVQLRNFNLFEFGGSAYTSPDSSLLPWKRMITAEALSIFVQASSNNIKHTY